MHETAPPRFRARVRAWASRAKLHRKTWSVSRNPAARRHRNGPLPALCSRPSHAARGEERAEGWTFAATAAVARRVRRNKARPRLSGCRRRPRTKGAYRARSRQAAAGRQVRRPGCRSHLKRPRTRSAAARHKRAAQTRTGNRTRPPRRVQHGLVRALGEGPSRLRLPRSLFLLCACDLVKFINQIERVARLEFVRVDLA